MPGKCKFREEWLSNGTFSGWIEKTDSLTEAKCGLCQKKIDIGNMGEAALRSHTKSAKHKKLTESSSSSSPLMSRFFGQAQGSAPNQGGGDRASSRSATVTLPASPARSQSTLATISGDAVLSAEVIHCLNMVEQHHSFNSSASAGKIYRAMFPDSEIANQFQCADKKAAYMLTFGIAPFILRTQMDKLKGIKHYVLLFDESLNGHLQSKQLDVHVRYWNVDKVETTYLTSFFMGHAKAIQYT